MVVALAAMKVLAAVVAIIDLAVEILLGDDRAREVDDPLTAAMPSSGNLHQGAGT